MAYCSQKDIMLSTDVETLRAIADRVGDVQPDDPQITKAITWAEMQINNKLASRYSVPFAAGAIPTTISFMCIDFTKHRLLGSGIQSENFAPALRSAWSMEIREARITLSMWATGPGRIPGATPSGVKAKISIGRAGSNVEPQFTMARKDDAGNIQNEDESRNMDSW